MPHVAGPHLATVHLKVHFGSHAEIRAASCRKSPTLAKQLLKKPYRQKQHL